MTACAVESLFAAGLIVHIIVVPSFTLLTILQIPHHNASFFLEERLYFRVFVHIGFGLSVANFRIFPFMEWINSGNSFTGKRLFHLRGSIRITNAIDSFGFRCRNFFLDLCDSFHDSRILFRHGIKFAEVLGVCHFEHPAFKCFLFLHQFVKFGLSRRKIVREQFLHFLCRYLCFLLNYRLFSYRGSFRGYIFRFRHILFRLLCYLLSFQCNILAEYLSVSARLFAFLGNGMANVRISGRLCVCRGLYLVGIKSNGNSRCALTSVGITAVVMDVTEDNAIVTALFCFLRKISCVHLLNCKFLNRLCGEIIGSNREQIADVDVVPT